MTILQNKEKITSWLDNYGIQNYRINDDMTVDVNGGVDLHNKNLQEISVQFNHVTGEFNISNNNLTSLSGSPRIVGGRFDCSMNEIENLRHSPDRIKASFCCYHNKIKSLEGAPRLVCGHFNVADNELESLQGAPDIIYDDLYLKGNKNINSFEGLSKKIEVDGMVFCDFAEPKEAKKQLQVYTLGNEIKDKFSFKSLLKKNKLKKW